MDKFGVFNLLNSLFALNGQNSTNTNNSSDSNPLNKILSSLSQNLSDKDKSTPVSTPPQYKPLQSSMLLTMTSHDEFVNRVKQKNKQFQK